MIDNRLNEIKARLYSENDESEFIENIESDMEYLFKLHDTAQQRIEELTAEVARVTAKYDRAVGDIQKYAKNVHTCDKGNSLDCHVKDNHDWCSRCPAWQYRELEGQE